MFAKSKSLLHSLATAKPVL